MSGLAVVVPALNEAARLPALLDDLTALPGPPAIVVADGGSTDGTAAVAARYGAAVVTGAAGRAAQMNAGARGLTTEWLCFLHADVRLPPPARAELLAMLAAPSADAAVWRFAVDAGGWWFRAIELGARLRDRLGGLPYGDQGLLIRRAQFEALGGYADLPLMEDVDLIRRVRRQGRLHRFSSAVVTSARRYRHDGPVRGWLRNAALITLYLAGVPPRRLARWYRAEVR